MSHKLEGSSGDLRQNVRRTVRQGLAEAMAEIAQANDAINAFEAQAEWSRRRAERGMRTYAVLIGLSEGEALLDEISDVVFHLDDLRGDLPGHLWPMQNSNPSESSPHIAMANEGSNLQRIT